MALETQRLDKWLWFARIVKTRGLAAQLITGGHVRLNGKRIETPARVACAGDVLTIALERQVRVLKIRGIAPRRGPFPEARLLYEDMNAGESAPEGAL